MDLILQTGAESKHILYSMREHIILRRIQSEFLSRPSYLTHDYAESLSGAFSDNQIYYSYITLNGALALKRTSDSQTIFMLEPDECYGYMQPQTVSFNGHIVLFYIVHNKQGSTWDLRYVITNHTSDEIYYILTNLSYKPVFSVLDTGTHLIIDIQGNDENSLWELSTDFELISHDEISGTLKQQSVWQLDKIGALQEDVEKLQQASNLMMNKISSLLDENTHLKNELSTLNNEKNTYSPKLKEQDEKIRELSESLTETKKALTIREAQIESAKKQYNELMDVAAKYRDEAIKWRTKLSTK